MPERGERDVKVVYKSRIRDGDTGSTHRHPSRDYDGDYSPRGNRDDLYRPRPYDDRGGDYQSQASTTDRSARGSHTDLAQPARTTTKTTYDVVKNGRSDAFVKRGDVVVINRPNPSPMDYEMNRSPRPRSPVQYEVTRSQPPRRVEYEIERPRRDPSGAYIVETDPYPRRDFDDRGFYEQSPRSERYYSSPSQSAPFDRSSGCDARGPPPNAYDGPRQSALSVAARSNYPQSYTRERIPELVNTRDAVRVTEEYDEYYNDREYQRGREDRSYAAGPRSSMRGSTNYSPDALQRKRSRSIGFRKDQAEYHDASERRHERPGAEAHVAGRYLKSNQEDDRYSSQNFGSRGRYDSGRSGYDDDYESNYSEYVQKKTTKYR